MTADDSRSEQVIEAYKRHKLSVSALHHIRRTLHEFDRQRATDCRLAIFGVIVIVTLLAVAAWWFFGGDRLLIS
jgi:hypothetical protein